MEPFDGFKATESGILKNFFIGCLCFAMIVYTSYLRIRSHNTSRATTINDYNNLIAAHPEMAELYLKRGQLFMTNLKYENASLDFEKCFNLGLNNDELRYNIALLNLKINNYEKALYYFNSTTNMGRYRLGSLDGICITFLAMGNNKSAIKCYDSVIAISPGNYSFYIGRAQAYANEGNSADALKDAAKSADVGGRHFESHYYYGIMLQYYGDNIKAIREFNASLLINPKNKKSYFARAESYKAINNYMQAEKEYNKSLTVDHDFVSAYIGRADLMYSLNQYERGTRDVFHAISLQPNNIEFYKIILKHVENEGNGNVAVDIFSKLILKYPNNGYPYAFRALVKAMYPTLGNPDSDFRFACKLGVCRGNNTNIF